MPRNKPRCGGKYQKNKAEMKQVISVRRAGLVGRKVWVRRLLPFITVSSVLFCSI